MPSSSSSSSSKKSDKISDSSPDAKSKLNSLLNTPKEEGNQLNFDNFKPEDAFTDNQLINADIDLKDDTFAQNLDSELKNMNLANFNNQEIADPDKSANEQTINSYMVENKMLQMKLFKLQSEINKVQGPPATKERIEQLEIVWDEKSRIIKGLEDENNELKDQNQALIDQLSQQKLEFETQLKQSKDIIKKKSDVIQNDKENIRQGQNLVKSQNIIIDQLK